MSIYMYHGGKTETQLSSTACTLIGYFFLYLNSRRLFKAPVWSCSPVPLNKMDSKAKISHRLVIKILRCTAELYSPHPQHSFCVLWKSYTIEIVKKVTSSRPFFCEIYYRSYNNDVFITKTSLLKQIFRIQIVSNACLNHLCPIIRTKPAVKCI